MISAVIVGWFFIVSTPYHSTKHQFYSQEACQKAQAHLADHYTTVSPCPKDVK